MYASIPVPYSYKSIGQLLEFESEWNDISSIVCELNVTDPIVAAPPSRETQFEDIESFKVLEHSGNETIGRLVNRFDLT